LISPYHFCALQADTRSGLAKGIIPESKSPVFNSILRNEHSTNSLFNLYGFHYPMSGVERNIMSSLHNVCAEDLAKLFHHYHEALAHDFHGHASRQADVSWEQAPQNERKLMIAAARLTLLELAATSEGELANRQYFAKPGEADWGC
jgi:hypothetical protein